MNNALTTELAANIIIAAARAFPNATPSLAALNASDVVARKSAIAIAARDIARLDETAILEIASAILQMSKFFASKNENKLFMQLSLDFEKLHDVKIEATRASMNALVRKMRENKVAA